MARAGGQAKTLMFINVSPVESDVDETFCSLNFAERVRRYLTLACRHNNEGGGGRVLLLTICPLLDGDICLTSLCRVELGGAVRTVVAGAPGGPATDEAKAATPAKKPAATGAVKKKVAAKK